MSTEHDCPVVRIGDIAKHPNADTLSITEVDGRPVIIRTGEFRSGDLAIYVPIDSLCPVDDVRFAFLAQKHRLNVDGKARLRAARLRGVFSMGLLVKPFIEAIEGEDARDLLRIDIWEPQEFGLAPDAEPDPGFLPVYDIESARKWAPIVLEEGEEVVITEKIHGCLVANTRISMADGTRKAIAEIVPGDIVLGVQHGRVTSSVVTQKFSNGTSDRWLRVTGERSRAGRGSSFFAITCTPEHQFFRPDLDCFVAAGTLTPGNRVTLLRSEMGLTPLQEQVLLGKLLGDGSLGTNGITSLVSWGHRSEDAAYIDWTARALGDLAASAREPQTSGYGSAMIRARTVSSPWIRERFDSFQSEAGKIVPEWVADALTPIALAFWYMDDGSLGIDASNSEAKAHFATCGFDANSCQVLIRGLRRLGIYGVLYGEEGRLRIRLNTDDAERLFLLVAPYVPPCMQRKLPERYRGHSGWLPSNERQYKPMLVEQSILSVNPAPPSRQTVRHDIETDTHNYFANGVLVHNSNGRFAYHTFRDGAPRLWCASRGRFPRKAPGEMWWTVAEREGLEERLSRFPGIAIYGEVYGQVQDLRYGEKGAGLVAFDAYDIASKTWLDYDAFWDVTGQMGLARVPILYRGPWSPALAGFAEGDSVLAEYNGAKHVREGWVLRPVRERQHSGLGRVILKRHGEGFLTRKEG